MSDVACPLNIGRKERRKRLIPGWIVLVITVLATPMFLHGQFPRWAGAALFVPTWFAMLCLIQAYQNT